MSEVRSSENGAGRFTIDGNSGLNKSAVSSSEEKENPVPVDSRSDIAADLMMMIESVVNIALNIIVKRENMTKGERKNGVTGESGELSSC